MIQLDYDKIVQDYNNVLISTSRGFETDHEFLESWVPRTNLKDSINDLIESAKDYEISRLKIIFNQNDYLNLKKLLTNNLKYKVNFFEKNLIEFQINN